MSSSTSTPEPPATSWSLIQHAASGDLSARELFARRYVTVVRSFLSARWRNTPRMSGELDDAVQEVFYECFREDGVLDRILERRPDSFRAFLLGISRNVARRWEQRASRRQARDGVPGVDLGLEKSDEPTPSRVFDRAWARAMLREAGELMEERARNLDRRARRRVELLRLRTRDNLPVRQIAKEWALPPEFLHKEYARARTEFRDALLEILSRDHPDLSAAALREKCVELLTLLRV